LRDRHEPRNHHRAAAEDRIASIGHRIFLGIPADHIAVERGRRFRVIRHHIIPDKLSTWCRHGHLSSLLWALMCTVSRIPTRWYLATAAGLRALRALLEVFSGPRRVVGRPGRPLHVAAGWRPTRSLFADAGRRWRSAVGRDLVVREPISGASKITRDVA